MRPEFELIRFVHAFVHLSHETSKFLNEFVLVNDERNWIYKNRLLYILIKRTFLSMTALRIFIYYSVRSSKTMDDNEKITHNTTNFPLKLFEVEILTWLLRNLCGYSGDGGDVRSELFVLVFGKLLERSL